jgi:ketosteroid isomerase-like protein
LRHLLFCALALAVPLAPAVAKPAPAATAQAAYQALLAADRGWSDRAKDKDLVTAIAAMMDARAVMVSGGATELIRGPDAIRARLAAKPENRTSAVEWNPVGGGVSADGSHGFTYGAMTVRPKDGTPQPLKYLAYWVKRPDGWRVAGYKRLGMRDAAALTPAGPILGRGGKRTDDAGATLKASEGAFSDEAQTIGLRAAFQKWGRPDSVNLSSPDGIAIGAQAIGELVGPPEPVSAVTWGADEVLVAPSGDMGLSYGLLHINAPQSGRPAVVPFFTIWARPAPGDPWRYVAE